MLLARLELPPPASRGDRRARASIPINRARVSLPAKEKAPTRPQSTSRPKKDLTHHESYSTRIDCASNQARQLTGRPPPDFHWPKTRLAEMRRLRPATSAARLQGRLRHRSAPQHRHRQHGVERRDDCRRVGRRLKEKRRICSPAPPRRWVAYLAAHQNRERLSAATPQGERLFGRHAARARGAPGTLSAGQWVGRKCGEMCKPLRILSAQMCNPLRLRCATGCAHTP